MANSTKNLPAKAGEDALVRAHELSLDELARHANEEARLAEESALGHAFRSGMFLLEAKARLEHGRWMPWLSQNWHRSQQTASRYMQLAEAADGRAERVAVLEAKSVRGALAALGKPVEGGGAAQNPRGANGPNYSRVSNLPDDAPDAVDADYTVAPDCPAPLSVEARALAGPSAPVPAPSAASPPAPAPRPDGRHPIVQRLDQADRACLCMCTTDGSDRAHALVAQAIPLLLEAGLYRLALCALPKTIQASEGVLWRFEEDLDKVARRLAKRWQDDVDPEARHALAVRPEADAVPSAALAASPEVLAQLRRTPLSDAAIRDAAYERPPVARPVSPGGPVEAEQLAMLLLRDAWTVLDQRITAARGASSAASLRALRDLLTPVVTAAELAARERMGPDRPDPPEVNPKKKPAKGEGDE